MNSQDATSLQDVLLQLQQAFVELHSTLIAERNCLAEHDVSSLEQLTPVKQSQLNVIEQLSDPLRPFLTHQQSFADSITALPATIQENLLDTWRHIAEQAKLCEKQNQVNGTVLAINLHNTRRILNLFQSSADTTSTETYDAKGQTRNTRLNQDYLEV